MKLPAQQMHELNDAQLNFERLQQKGVVDATALAAGAAASNVGTLGGALAGTLPNPSLATGTVLQLVSTGTTRKIAIGSSAITFSTSTIATPQVVSHGLGVSPLYVGMTLSLGGTSTVISMYVGAASSTTFTAAAAASVSTNGTINFFWIAIG